MAAATFLCFFIFLIISHIPESSSQQNIETFYPFSPPPLPSIVQPPATPGPPSSLPPPTGPAVVPPRRSSTKAAVGRAIGVTAASTVVLSGLLLFLLLRYNSRRKREESPPSAAAAGGANGRSNGVAPQSSFTRYGGNVKGLIVDENGLDVLYWRNLQEGENQSGYKKQNFKSLREEQQEEEKRIVSERERERKSKPPVQEVPLLRGQSSTSQSLIWAAEKDVDVIDKAPSFSNGVALKVEKQASSVKLTPPPLPPPPGAPWLQPSRVSAAVAPAAAVVAAIPNEKTKAPTPPPPPPIPSNKGPAPPPPPAAAMKPPPPNKRSSSSGESSASEKVKLKPLHWDKVNPNVEHSMVWDKIDKGSFKFDGDLMEALFGSVAVNRKSPRGGDTQSASPLSNKSGPPSQIFILDTRKSQNTAIVLKSLSLSRKEIIDALIQGRGLSGDTIEKLTRIAPTEEEASEIAAFHGDPTRLADAESFLFHLLKSVPTAFSRFNAMLFRSNYDSEVSNIKESFKALEAACKELRTRGLFLKLLEAVLKAGNRLNAGTSRGNAQAFNLTALRKLSDVKSSDGKTTLLQFVVQEVVRAEGKRCVLNRNRSLSSNGGGGDAAVSKDERERDYMMLGLPVIGGLSAEFSNVKKAATLDYDALAKSISALAAQVSKTRNVVQQCGGGGFAREMNGFVDTAELEMRVVREEEARAMELVKKTTDYYQAGDKGANPFQLFVIVRDFLGMVDEVCIEIARNVQKRKSSAPATSSLAGSSSPGSPRVFRFPKLPANFMSDNSKSGGDTDSDDSESEV
ncbi:formin-like protein 8 [Salvia miltiorrhiza]|uniref:formin-like protein 8 n=1 Tax=Salvia miltiorrhiza TaxID=226208 RepID=UPI0025AC56FD|nr:formin-like protein 8 [Salvia miltiorrhiza]